MPQKKDYRKNFLPILAVLAAVLLGEPVLSYAHQHVGIFNPVSVRSLLQAPETDLLHKTALADFYEERENKLLWRLPRRDQAKAVLAVLEESWTHGLNPGRYHAAEIRALLDKNALTRAEQVQLDILLSHAVAAYGHDITGMRVDAGAVGQHAEYWRRPQEPAAVLAAVTQAGNPAQALRNLAPKGQLYELLRAELVRLYGEERAFEDMPSLTFGGAWLFKPGQRHSDVAALRLRLGLPEKPEFGPADVYDDTLAAAVMRFQRESGVKADGVIGPNTLALLNRGRQEQIGQLIVNMERLRWLEQEQPDRYVLVNVPSQMLWAIEDGRVAHKMRVVVGQPSRKTRSFKAEITGIRFNPTWTVPPGIKIKDMLPKLQEDPYSLAASGIELYYDGQNIDPGSVDWFNISRHDLNDIRMVQSSGDHNALGRIRVLMPNRYNIYLHDTNHPEFFAEDQRTFSSGCIRMAEPAKMAHFILGHNESWSDDKMQALIAEGKMAEIRAAAPLPVYIVYQTVWLDDDGGLVYGPDIYKHDEALLAELRKSDAFQPFDFQYESEAAARQTNGSLASASRVGLN